MANQEEEAMQGEEMRRGTWLEEEDERLVSLVQLMGERRWDALAKASGESLFMISQHAPFDILS